MDSLKFTGDEAIGLEIVRKACFQSTTAIANNCGQNGSLIAEKVAEKDGSIGYNGLTGIFSDLVKDGVVDPVLVTKSALIHAASIAGMLITISAMITDKPEPKKAVPSASGMGGMDMMGGMGGGLGGMGGMM